MTENRYFVDKRVGCMAVRDRTETDPDYNGLHPDTEGVIRYWAGIIVEKGVCPCCNRQLPDERSIRPEDEEEAERLCRNLNLYGPAKTT